MHRRRLRLRRGRLNDPALSERFKVQGSGFNVPSPNPGPGTQNSEQRSEDEVSAMGPQINIIGSFFPSWMLCAAIGIVAALLGRWLFVRMGLDPYVGPRALVY